MAFEVLQTVEKQPTILPLCPEACARGCNGLTCSPAPSSFTLCVPLSALAWPGLPPFSPACCLSCPGGPVSWEQPHPAEQCSAWDTSHWTPHAALPPSQPLIHFSTMILGGAASAWASWLLTLAHWSLREGFWVQRSPETMQLLS